MSQPTVPTSGNAARLKTLVHVGLVAALSAFAAAPHAFAGEGDVDGRDFLIWQRNVGAAATETAELAVLNTCNKTIKFSMNIHTSGAYDTNAEAAQKIALRPGKAAVLPLVFPPVGQPNGRRHLELIVNAEPSPCISARKKGLVLSLAILDQRGGVLDLFDLPSNGELLPAAPAPEAKRARRRGDSVMKLVRVGTDQEGEVSIFNRCREEVEFKLVANVLDGTDNPVKKKLLLPAGDGSVIPVPAFDNHDGWIEINSITQTVTRAACKRGWVDATAAVFATVDGETRASIKLAQYAVNGNSP